jgi:hypothetical protein
LGKILEQQRSSKPTNHDTEAISMMKPSPPKHSEDNPLAMPTHEAAEIPALLDVMFLLCPHQTVSHGEAT